MYPIIVGFPYDASNTVQLFIGDKLSNVVKDDFLVADWVFVGKFDATGIKYKFALRYSKTDTLNMKVFFRLANGPELSCGDMQPVPCRIHARQISPFL